MRTTIARDVFARCDTVREKVAKGHKCAWCGKPARFRYGTHADGIATRPSWANGEFCSVGCFRTFHS